LDSCGEAGNVGDVPGGDRAAIDDVDLAGGSEARGGDIVLADKVLVYKGYSSSAAIYKAMGSDRLSIK
jgi:hypothetical protein